MNEKKGTMVLSAESGGVGVTVQELDRSSTAVLTCSGYIDTYNSAGFTAAVRAVMERGYRNLIFDLAGVTYMSSSGIGCFTSFLKAVKPEGGDLVLVAPTEKVLEVFALLGFKTFFNITDSIEEALSQFPAVEATTTPFSKLEAITDTFGRLERFVAKDKQPEFYSEILAVLREIQELREAAA